MKKLIALAISAIFLIVITVFILQNSQIAEIQFLFWQAQASLSMILFTTFSIGILTAVVAIVPTIYHLKKLRNQSQEKVKSLTKENKKLTEPKYKSTLSEGQLEE